MFIPVVIGIEYSLVWPLALAAIILMAMHNTPANVFCFQFTDCYLKLLTAERKGGIQLVPLSRYISKIQNPVMMSLQLAHWSKHSLTLHVLFIVDRRAGHYATTLTALLYCSLSACHAG